MNALIRRIDPRRPAIITPAGLRRIILGSSEGERLMANAAHGPAVKPVRSQGPSPAARWSSPMPNAEP